MVWELTEVSETKKGLRKWVAFSSKQPTVSGWLWLATMSLQDIQIFLIYRGLYATCRSLTFLG